MRLKISSLLLAGGVAYGFSYGLDGLAVKAAAPPTPQGYMNFRTYPGDQRGAIRDGTAVPDGVFYPKRAEGPYNGYPGPDPGDDETRPANIRENYNMELIGYFYPPKDGNIQFAIAVDDPGELYFSTDENPANKKLIASEPQWNGQRSFGGGDPTAPTRRNVVSAGDPPVPRPENWSPYIKVTKGKPYFIQAIGTEFGGGDNTAVAFRYEGDPDFQDGDLPIKGQYLSPFAVPATPVILAQPKDAAVLAGGSVTFSVAVDVPPTATLSGIKWTKNGTDVPNSDSLSLTVPATIADDGAKFRAIITTSAGTLQSSEATLTVATISTEFAQGVVKFEAYTGISGTAIDGLTGSDKFINNQPDDIRLLGSIDTPNGYGDNYGAKVSGFIIPPETGSYRFFIRSDDASQFWLSKDDKEANAQMIAEETGCCEGFKEPDNAETSEPQSLTAGRRYAFYALVKEGGGGDFLQVALRKEGDTTPAANLRPIAGAVIGANAKISKGDLTITKQPTPITTDEGRPVTLSVDATTSPAGFNLPLLVQWQKNGQDIRGATDRNFTIADAKVADSGKYRAVLNVAGVKSVNSAEVDVAINPDTSGPLIAAVGAVKKGASIELGVAFDEKVDAATAGAASAYTVSKGSIQSARHVSQSSGAVLVVSGVNAGDTVTVTAKGVKDTKGNVRDTTSKEVKIPTKLLTWVGVGGDELNVSLNRTDFNDDVVARGEQDFDLISGGSAHWTNYDEETFVYEEVTGNFDKVVRVEYQDPVTQWSRAGLDAREALDEGKTRDDVAAGYKFSQHFTIRVNPPAVVGWDGRVGNNGYEVIHRPVEGANYSGYNTIFNIQSGSSNPPNYPDAWLRLKRDGQKITAYRSSDGKTWAVAGEVTYQNDPESPENEVLADNLFVGMFYGPEFLNINDEEARKSRSASIAKFRDYGDFGAAPPPPPGGAIQSVTLSGANVVITFTGSLEQADSITGPWTDVTGSSPLTIAVSGKTAQFFRVKR